MIKTSHILASTYFDRCTVYGMENVKVGSITKQQRVKKYEGIPCHLSQDITKVSGESIAKTSYKHKLFVLPDVNIKSGDEIYVVQQGVYTPVAYIASQPFRYHNSHVEVELSRSDYE